jgi:hypothetical protein
MGWSGLERVFNLVEYETINHSLSAHVGAVEACQPSKPACTIVPYFTEFQWVASGPKQNLVTLSAKFVSYVHHPPTQNQHMYTPIFLARQQK